MRTAIPANFAVISEPLRLDLNKLLLRLRAARRSDNTVNEYSYLLAELGAFLTRSERRESIQVTMADLMEYWMSLIDRRPKYEPSTLQLRHNVIRLYIVHLLRQGGTTLTQRDLDEFEEVRPKSRKRLPQVNWSGLYTFICRLAADRTPPETLHGDDLLLWWRKRALYATLFCTALRITELLSIDRATIAGDYVDIIGKGDKQHRAYLSDDALYFLNGYREARRDNCPALFVAHEAGTPAARLSARSVQRELNHDGEVWGIAGTTRKSSLTPHKLRHLAAKMLLEQTGNMEAVRRLLNHASISTTQIYANMAEDFLEATVRSQHPAFHKPGTPQRSSSRNRPSDQLAES